MLAVLPDLLDRLALKHQLASMETLPAPEVTVVESATKGRRTLMARQQIQTDYTRD